MKRRFCIWMVVFIVVLLFNGCGDGKKEETTSEENLYGQWEKTEGRAEFSSVEFFDDGTYTTESPNLKGDFSITGNRIKFEGYLVEDVVETFEVKDNELHFLYDDGQIKCTFVKQ